MFLTGIGAAAVIPVVGKAANLTKGAPRKKKAKHRVPFSGKILANQWKLLASTKLAGQVPPGFARQVYRCLAAAAGTN
jgi:hypothetical protein